MDTMTDRARRLAHERHQGQTYAGTLPYTYHLDRVETIVSNWTDHCEPLVMAARLHDVVEDTNTPLYEIEALFGPHVAYVVGCVTDEPGENREARFQKTAPKIQTSLDAQLVKLADRHANMQACLEFADYGRGKMYLREWDRFRSTLESPPLKHLWSHTARTIVTPLHTFIHGKT